MTSIELKDVLVPSISVAALLFTVGTFWWNNWRRGRLRVATPRTYGAHQSDEMGIRILLPVAISNTGAIPIVVDALRIKIGSSQVIVPWEVTRSAMALTSSDTWEFAANFVVSGRSSLVRFCEFVHRKEQPLQPEFNEIVLEALSTGRQRWGKVASFMLYVDPERPADLRRALLVYDNARALPDN